MINLTFLGGCSEIGANSCFLDVFGTKFLIDSGLHPERRDQLAFPQFEYIGEQEIAAMLITHAHSDHIGALPFAIKHFPKARVLMTQPTSDLAELMLNDTAKILKSNIAQEFTAESLEYYKNENIQNLFALFESIKYNDKITFENTFSPNQSANVSFHEAGHILGSAGVLIESNGRNIFHTGDVNFQNTALLKKANFPRHHLDVLIIESTNANSIMPDKKEQTKDFANFINKISNSNGSILIPTFSLGKAQEILRIISSLAKKGSIPNLPIYTHGLTRRINKVYDKYCYSSEMLKKGFEVSDINQEYLDLSDSGNSNYLKSPSIVLANGGMMNERTMSYRIALEWFKRKNFGIAMVGFQKVATPGHSLLNSSKNKNFSYANLNLSRSCEVEKFRFSAHSGIEELIEFAVDTKPKNIFIVHGDEEACDKLAYEISQRLDTSRIFVPKLGKNYEIEL